MDQDVEPIRRALSAQIGYLKMYREDVEELLAIFQQTCEKVTISDQKHRYKTLDAMRRTVSSPIKELTIRGENPDVQFLFNRSEVVSSPNGPTQRVFNELRTEISSEAADSLFYKVKDFLLMHQRPKMKQGYLVGVVMTFIGTFWVALHYSVTDSQGQFKMTPRSLIGFLIGFLFIILFVGLTVGGMNYVTLEKRRDAPSFFARNKEEFAKQAVTASISTIIGAIIGFIVGHYLK
jgi:hypothetical protein